VFNRTFEPKKEDKRMDKIHTEELYDSYYSPNIVRVIKSNMMCWVRHAPHMEKMQNWSWETSKQDTTWKT